MNRSVMAAAVAMVLLAVLMLVGYLIALRTRAELVTQPRKDTGFTPAAGVPSVATNPREPPPAPAAVPAQAMVPALPMTPATPATPAPPPALPPPATPPPMWQPVGLSGGGSMYTPAISPLDSNRMMLNCDMSGAYISADGGHNWIMINGNQLGGNTRCKPCWSPSDIDTVYAAGGWGGRLMVSHNAGNRWEPIGDIKESLVGAIAIDPEWRMVHFYQTGVAPKDARPDALDKIDRPMRFLVGTRNGAWMSTDAAEHFTACAGVTGSGIGFVFDQTSHREAHERVCFAATSVGIWRSDDDGATWTKKMKGLAGGEAAKITAFAGGSSVRKKLVRLYCSVPCSLADGKLVGGVFRSDDKGETWVTAMGDGINVDTKKVDPYGDGDLPQYTQVFTTDVNPDIVYAMNTSTGFWPPHHPTVFRSDDAGQHWKATLFMDPRFKDQYNVDWDYHTAVLHQSYQEGAEGAAIAPGDPNTLIRVGSMEGLITHDGGKTWFPAHTRLAPGQKPEPDAAFECNGLVVTTTWHYFIDPFKPNIHYICYTDIGFARSEDSGKTWRWWSATERPPWSNTTYDLAFDPTVPGKIWGAFSNVHDIPNGNSVVRRDSDEGPGGVALSTDFGVTWKPVSPDLPNAPVTSIVIDPKSPEGSRTLYATVYGVGLFKSTDDGKHWAKKSAGLGTAENQRLYRVLLHPDGTLFCVITGKLRNRQFLETGAGVYRSKDGGETWSSMNASQPMLWPKDITLDPTDSKILYVGLCNANGQKTSGLWRTKDGGASWENLGSEGPETFGGYLSTKHPGWIYTTLTEDAHGPGLWLSKDDGKTWAPFNALPFHNIMRVTEDPADAGMIYLSTFGGSVWHGPAEPGR